HGYQVIFEETFECSQSNRCSKKASSTNPGYQDIYGIRLIFTSGALYDDERTLVSYGVQHKSVIHVVIMVPGGGRIPSPPVPCRAL
ncbi:unnamed protein product, partial [Gadus morhua 'NCC']